MFLDENPSTEVLKNTLIEKKDLGYLIFEFKGDFSNLKEIKEFWKENGIHTMFIPSESNTDQKLKDKILKTGIAEESGLKGTMHDPKTNSVREETLAALAMLGFAAAASQKVVDKIMAENPTMKVEQVIKQALKML